MVRTRRSTSTSRPSTPQTSTPRNSATPLNHKSRRKREHEDSEEEYSKKPSSRKRKRLSTPKRTLSHKDKQGRGPGGIGHRNKEGKTAGRTDQDQDSGEDEEGFWQVKRVVEERQAIKDSDNLITECLVEWKPSPGGRVYKPEWIPIDFLNDQARQDWEKDKKKQEKQKGQAESKRREVRNQRGLRDLTPGAKSAPRANISDIPQLQTLNASTPTRSRFNSVKKHVRPKIKSRAIRDTTLSEEPIPSIASVSSPEPDLVSPSEPLLPSGRVAVLLRKPDNFDPSEYQSVSVQSSSQKVSDLEEDDLRIAFGSQLSQATIPDSQDLSGQWDHKDPASQSAFRPDYEPGSPKSLNDQRPVTTTHSTPGDKVEDTVVQQQPQQPVYNPSSLNVEGSPVVDLSADFDPGFPDPDNKNSSFEDNNYHNIESCASTANHSDKEGPEVDSSQDDQDTAINGVGIVSLAPHITNLSSNEHNHLNTESSQETQDSFDNQSFETANSQNSLAHRSSPKPDAQKSTWVDQSSEDLLGTIDDLQSQTVDCTNQKAGIKRAVVNRHRSQGEGGNIADWSLSPAKSNTNLQSCDSEEPVRALRTDSCLKSISSSREVTQSQEQISSSGEIDCVIPDSQSYSNTSAHTSASRVFAVLSQDQVTPYVSQTVIVPDSATTDSDIPSRQPDQLHPVSPEKEERPGSSVPSDPDSHHSERVVATSARGLLISSNTSNPPVYYTQPQVSHKSPSIPSSFSSKHGVLDKAAHSVTDQTSQLLLVSESGVGQGGRLEESQGNQIVVSEPHSKEVVPSQEGVFASDLQPLPAKANGGRGSEWQLKSHPQKGSTSEPPSELPSSSSKIREMERSASQPPKSAVDELLSYIDFGKDSFLKSGDSPGENLDETPYDVPSEGHSMDNADTVGLDVVVGSSEGIIQSQPAYSVDPWKPEALGNTPEALAPSISPASIMPVPNTHMSAVESMQQAVNLAFGVPDDLITRSGLSQDVDDSILPGTIPSAAISRSVDPVASAHTLDFPGQDIIPSVIESSGHSITMGQVANVQDSDISSQSSQQDDGFLQYSITLPMHASRRPYYGEVIKDHKAEIQAFSRFFTGETQKKPDEALIQKINDLFDRLFGICDYPQDVIGSGLETQPSSDIARYCCDANPKLSFLFELMSALGDNEKEILIVVRSQELMRLIFALTEVASIECSAEGINKRTDYPSATRVTLALSTEEFDPFNFDVVIGYDFHYSRSSIARQLYSKTSRKSPIVLLLVTTHSIEHVSLHPLDNVSDLEAKNAILACTVSAGRYLEDPERGYGEPHEVAEVFAGYLNGITDILNWAPQSIPDDVLDIFENPMSQTRALFSMDALHGNGLKRKHTTDDDDADSKRICLPLRDLPVDLNNPPVPLAVRQLLDSVAPREGKRESMITIPLESLESLRQKFEEHKRRSAFSCEVEVELKSHINRLDTELKDFKKTSNKIGLSNRTALQERTMFEKEKKKIEAAAQLAAETAQRERAQKQEEIRELESRISRLMKNPESVHTELSDTRQQLKVSEDKLKSALSDVEFMRGRYQDASAQVSRLTNENKALISQNKDLSQKASANLLAIHAQNSSGQLQTLLQQIASLQAQNQQKDMELATAHQKLNSFANGRNTRGGSMPRSPRVPSGMSPRPGRSAFTGSASRGTSPSGPGAQFMSNQARSERWSQLQ
ncbi:hypothetical protein FHETE_9537 [Fusarium heterosporum]|uniref:Chromo domain-containing protein n=1 Tax=Fusarium heterosporum TaxID=42747 RepID=A0A8H5SX27_FUSHE|nr:hypothetical protein FHETE_9537 [Fusarium heterosporum]